MKRILCALLAALLLIPCASAEMTWSEWLAQYTDEALENIASLIHSELIRRKVEPFDVNPGIYSWTGYSGRNL